ncbi:sigma-70 family RNA polymerase sigma factor [Pseudodonghicola flavimaris]|uniref:RNA polymerase sigma factor n=1 Tax=Pseudodonghicola flavimaris TaxID=3050036 RepID=A0ABT7F1V8_9RHOB|nr:sigma-70 family RNA polymerase sigma factor [Pseudodonghicola flavimaris]MDK3018591.1 sigma-70 family RNA polymerase sigma factor [Pseudodonghicola flavimaris]
MSRTNSICSEGQTRAIEGAAVSPAPIGAGRDEGMDQVPPESFSETTRWLIAVRDRRDRQAFGMLFDHFAPRLKAMLIRGGLRDGSAEDVVQDVMLAVWHKAAQFDPHRAEASAWIYRIARNRQIDLIRRRPPPAPEDLPEIESGDPDAAQILALDQEGARLRAALSALNPDQSTVLQQAFFEELPHSEISQISGLPLGTIKSRIRLGLDRLRRELKDLR